MLSLSISSSLRWPFKGSLLSISPLFAPSRSCLLFILEAFLSFFLISPSRFLFPPLSRPLYIYVCIYICINLSLSLSLPLLLCLASLHPICRVSLLLLLFLPLSVFLLTCSLGSAPLSAAIYHCLSSLALHSSVLSVPLLSMIRMPNGLILTHL